MAVVLTAPGEQAGPGATGWEARHAPRFKSRVHRCSPGRHSYSPGWEYTVPTSILKEPTRVPLRSRFLE